ncbi:MAG: peptidase [Candidatus Latescibacteria bacterium]|jgi:serine protease AprX|nr:peptidase [Candidatus Latescibacterota bacterium]
MKWNLFLFFIVIIFLASTCTTSQKAITLWQLSGDITKNNYYGYDLNNIPLDVGDMPLKDFAFLEYDNHTKWGKVINIPSGFTPEKWLEGTKNPGLNVKELHIQGIKGKGVSLALIDKPINPNHSELNGRINYYQVITDSAKVYNYRLHCHGIACASILCGENCGVAPESELFYIAVPDDTRDLHNHCLAVEKLIEINSSLPEGKKIKAVSISHYVASVKNEEQVKIWAKFVKKANEHGIAVIYSDLQTTHAFFTGGGCPPYKDNNNPDNYDFSPWAKEYTDRIIVPADFRTTGNNKDTTHYTYWGDGGFSWAIPYLTGLAGLAWGIDESLTIEQIFGFLVETKTETASGKLVINPNGFIDAVRLGI